MSETCAPLVHLPLEVLSGRLALTDDSTAASVEEVTNIVPMVRITFGSNPIIPTHSSLVDIYLSYAYPTTAVHRYAAR